MDMPPVNEKNENCDIFIFLYSQSICEKMYTNEYIPFDKKKFLRQTSGMCIYGDEHPVDTE
jgi:hypothetical protein